MEQIKVPDDIVFPAFLYDALHKIAEEQGFNPGNYSINFQIGSNVGDGFVAAMYNAIILENGKELVLMCKLPPFNETRRKEFKSMALFKKEVFVYKKLLPAFQKFQKDKGISETEGFFNTPTCYFAHYDEEKDEAAIIMEDLRRRDYKMWNKFEPVDFAHVKLLMIQLGKLHAISLAMKKELPEVFEEFTQLTDVMGDMMNENEGFKLMTEISFNRALSVLQPHEEFKKEKLLRLKENFVEDFKICTAKDKAEPFSVVCHGDCWINNFMYSYENGAPKEIILLDWQITRYTSPVLDLVYFIFACTEEKLRGENYDTLIQIYHNALREHLERLGGTPAVQFPFTAFLRHLKAYGKFGLIMSIFMIPLLCTPNEDLPDMDEVTEKYLENKELMKDFLISEKTEKKYQARMGGVIRDIIRLGYV